MRPERNLILCSRRSTMNRLLLTILVCAAWPAWAVAQQSPADLFTRLDVNKDGKVSRDELPDRQKENFARIDADGNGAISRDELQKFTGGNQRPDNGQPGRAAVEPTHADV